MAFLKHFTRTAAALAVFDAGAADRRAVWETASTTAAVDAAEAADRAAIEAVKAAYYEDKGRLLPMEEVRKIDLEFMRRMVAEDGAAPSIAYKHGAEAAWRGEKLQSSALRNLHPNSAQYHDFIAGYDSNPNWHEVNMKSSGK